MLTDLERAVVAQLHAQLGAVLVLPADPRRYSTCPVCGVRTARNRHGQRCLCLRCSERETGEYADEMADRITAGLTLKRWLALPRDDNGRPITPPLSAARQRKRNR